MMFKVIKSLFARRPRDVQSLINDYGAVLGSGKLGPRDISELKDWQPEVYAQLMEILRTLEAHFEDMQDTEFTVEEGRLYMLQTRNAKRPAQAAVRFAVDAVEEGLLDRAMALMTIDAEKLDALLHPTFDADASGNQATLKARAKGSISAPIDVTFNASATRADFAAGIAAGPSLTAPEVIADPHVAQHHMLVEMPRSDDGPDPVLVPGNPVKLSKVAEGPETRVPWLGEHTNDVLGAELGLTDAELSTLRSEGVIG